MSNPVITTIDLINPPARKTCDAGGKYSNDTIYFMGNYAECQPNDKLGTMTHTEDKAVFQVQQSITSGILPDGKRYDFCIKPATGFIRVIGLHSNYNSNIMNSIRAQTTGCPVQATMQAVSGPICELQNQVYDKNIQTCVSCRDPSAAAPTLLSTLDSNPIINNTIKGGQYKCINTPIKTYDPSGNLLNQTCDSGETFNKDKMCESIFWAKK